MLICIHTRSLAFLSRLLICIWSRSWICFALLLLWLLLFGHPDLHTHSLPTVSFSVAHLHMELLFDFFSHSLTSFYFFTCFFCGFSLSSLDSFYRFRYWSHRHFGHHLSFQIFLICLLFLSPCLCLASLLHFLPWPFLFLFTRERRFIFLLPPLLFRCDFYNLLFCARLFRANTSFRVFCLFVCLFVFFFCFSPLKLLAP